MEKFETEINYQATKELTHKRFVIYFTMLIVSLLGFATFLTLAAIFNQLTTIWFIVVLFVFIFLLILSGFFVFALSFARYRSKNVHIKFGYQFNKDDVVIYTYDKDKRINSMKVKYSDILFYTESKNYYFLYLNARTSFPLMKKDNISSVIKIINLENMRKRFI